MSGTATSDLVRDTQGRAEPVVTGLVHDYLLTMRGAERTFAHLAACYPHAPIYTLLYDEIRTGGVFRGRVAGASMLQRLPIPHERISRLPHLLSAATETLELGEHDVVVSSSVAVAHGVRPRAVGTHVCYCHGPFRHVWHERQRALRAPRPFVHRELERMRRWDLHASQRVDHFIANSKLTQQRIADFWGRASTVVHPPVEVERFNIGTPEDFLLIVSRLVPSGHVEDALIAAERADRRVKVVGAGPELRRLRTRFGRRVEFLGNVQDDHLADLMSRAQALVVPDVKAFGIAAVESLAAGRPVVGPDVGGTAETVIDGETGVLFGAGDIDGLTEIMREVDFAQFNPVVLRSSTHRFGVDRFRARVQFEVSRLTGGLGITDRSSEHRHPFSQRERASLRPHLPMGDETLTPANA